MTAPGPKVWAAVIDPGDEADGADIDHVGQISQAVHRLLPMRPDRGEPLGRHEWMSVHVGC